MSNELFTKVLELPTAKRMELRILLDASLSDEEFCEPDDTILDDEFEEELLVRQRSLNQGNGGYDVEETLREARSLFERNAS